MEGPGSQALSIMAAINFARMAGISYVHTLFSNILHSDRPMEQWNAAWEQLFNLGAGETPCTRKDVISYEHATDGLALCFGISQVEAVRFAELMSEFRARYRLNHSPRPKEQAVSIAVHIRRGPDVAPTDPLFTPTPAALQSISQVSVFLKSSGIAHRISVYSEGDADFADIHIPGVDLAKYRVGRRLPKADGIIDIDALSAMRQLVDADVLIMSKGSLSYCAALFSEGIKIAEADPWHSGVHNLIICDKEGRFDPGLLRFP